MRAALPLLLLARVASGQQLEDVTAEWFPTPAPEEYTHEVVLGDVDHDGDLDLVLANGDGYDGPIAPAQTRLYVNDGKGHFTDQTAERLADLAPGYARDADLADVDGDGDLDLVLAGAFGDPPRLLVNVGGGYFKDETAARLPPHDGGFGAQAAAADVDLDGDLDLYLTDSGKSMFGPPGGQDRLYLNDGQGTFTDATKERLPKLLGRAAIACVADDLDNDGDLDVLVTHRDTPNVLLRNDGTGHFTDASYLLAPDGSHSYEVAVGDLDGDGWLDLLVTNGDPKGTVKEQLALNAIPDGEGFYDVSDFALPAADANPAADDNEADLWDLDDDGDLDVVIAAISPGVERVLINDGKGVFSSLGNVIAGPSDSTLDLEIGDLDGDGRADLVTAQGESGSFVNRVYRNTGAVDTHAPVVGPVVVTGPFAPYLGPLVVLARVRDGVVGDDGPAPMTVTVAGAPMAWAGGEQFRGEVDAGLIVAPLPVPVVATDAGGHEGSGPPTSVTPRSPLDVFPDGKADDTDLALMIDHLTDKGGLGDEGDLDGDGDVDLGDAQLLAAGLGGAPTLARVWTVTGGKVLLVGANFGDAPKVTAGGVEVPVDAKGPVSILAAPPPGAIGPWVVEAGGVPSNPLEETSK